VYWSQVTDVVAHLNSLGGPSVRLMALISLRGFRENRRKILAHSPDAIVLPMVPRLKHWRANTFWVNRACRRLRPSGIMARGVLGTWLAIQARERGLVGSVCFDARGATAAEWEEYRIIDDDGLIAMVGQVEREAVQRSDFRLAVSEALVDHWRERYNYHGADHVVVPCALAASHLADPGDPWETRKSLGFSPEDVVLVYSGSAAGWQSFTLLERAVSTILATQPRVKVLFLSPPDPAIEALVANWSGRALRMWVKPHEVQAVLNACDHALLIREDTITNRVASPTKFAEYLACGLPVIISAHIGDFSETVRKQGLGTVYNDDRNLPMLERPLDGERRRLRELAMAAFAKTAHNDSYRRVLDVLST
jgi:glycosyltransferase involved in cell wall biosynthesis